LLAVGAVLCLLVPATVAKLMVIIFAWVAALLIAVAGLRARDAEDQNHTLRDEVRRYREAHAAQERSLLAGLGKGKGENPLWEPVKLM
jgi:hypothetical protein